MDRQYELLLITGEKIRFSSSSPSAENIQTDLFQDWFALNPEKTRWIRSSAVIGIDDVTDTNVMIKKQWKRLEMLGEANG